MSNAQSPTRKTNRLVRFKTWQDRFIVITKVIAWVFGGISLALFALPGILSGAIFRGFFVNEDNPASVDRWYSGIPLWVQQTWDLSLKALLLGMALCLIGVTSFGIAWFAYRIEKRTARSRGKGITTYACPCCGYLTLEEKPPGTYEICPVCFWEDDLVQYNDPNYDGGANKVSLNQARVNYRLFGADDKEYLRSVRKPLDSEAP